MNRHALLILLLLPSLSHAVICRTVGEDGVVSFTEVPLSECPPGSRMPVHTTPAAPGTQVEGVDAGSTTSKPLFAGYRSVEVVSPADDGIVHSNERKVTVKVKLEPALRSNHVITVYLDGKAFSGAYGSSEIELTAVDPGTHELWVKVRDRRGNTVIESSDLSFSLLITLTRIQVEKVTPDSIKGTFGGHAVEGSTVTIRFPISGNEYQGTVAADGSWNVTVGGEPTGESRFDVKVKTGSLEFKRSVTITPADLVEKEYQPTYKPGTQPSYKPEESELGYPPAEGKPSYAPEGGSISTTPDQTNPAFQPQYVPVPDKPEEAKPPAKVIE